MTIYLFQFNNYYNRVVKKYNAISDYQTNGKLVHSLNGTNFNPNDGITTSHIFNYDGAAGMPDYAVVWNNGIESRWYITECVRTQGKQFYISLLRDVIADWYDEVCAAPCFIEKATLSRNDPGIYNSENMSYNQIRKEIRELTDKSFSPWLVGYIPRNAFTEDKTIVIPYSSGVSSVTADYRVNSIEQWAYAGQLNKPYNTSATSRKVTCVYQQPDNAYPGPQELVSAYTITSNGVSWGSVDSNQFESIKFKYTGMVYGQSSYYARTVGGVLEGFPNNVNDYQGIYNVMSSMIEEEQNSEAWDYSDAFFGLSSPSIESQVGKTVLETSTNTLYTIRKKTVTSEKSIPITGVNGGYFRDYWKAYFLDSPTMSDQYGNQFKLTADSFILKGTVRETTYFLDSSSIEDAYIHFKVDEIGKCEDSPYDIFCMPFSSEVHIQSSINYTGDKDLALGVGSSLSAELGDGAVYDVQILPYCPLQQYLTSSKILNARNIPKTKIVDINNELIGELFWVKNSAFNFELSYSLESDSNNIDFKIQHECDFYRLCSPNMSSVFEFKPTMFENGVVESFEVDCVYKPFNPYIHINPKFSGMYGNYSQYETRGLTLGGDFSLARTSNAWENYELNNKYYKDIFDRQVQSLELQNKYQGIQDWVNMGTGTLSGAASGALGGAMAGGGWGALAGGIAGGVGSAVGGLQDVYMNRRLREDALDLTKDQFGYNLQTIQAIPDTLTRTSCLNQNNPLVPTLEYYTCTDVEKQALRNKIKYNGMTVMRIGTINEFKKTQPSYIKGKIIRMESLGDDYHVATAIADEINQGVFI